MRTCPKPAPSAAKASSRKPAVAEGKSNSKSKSGGSGRKDKLVIVESPAKAKTIGRYLGRGYVVKSSLGHVRDLLKSRLAWISSITMHRSIACLMRSALW